MCFQVIPAMRRAGGETQGHCVSASPGRVSVGFSWDIAVNAAGDGSWATPHPVMLRPPVLSKGDHDVGPPRKAPGTTCLMFTNYKWVWPQHACRMWVAISSFPSGEPC